MTRADSARIVAAVSFIAAMAIFASTLPVSATSGWLLISAVAIAAYMAMNIGANDVANNVGPAVGSGALTMGTAIVLAAVFEFLGAMIAGGDVVTTVKNGIIDPEAIANPDTFIGLMMAALLASALWLHLATAMGAPVSTTHAIVGGVLGAGVAAGGLDVANWDQVWIILGSWIISPIMGGVIAAGFLYLIKRTITWQKQTMDAVRRMVPLLLSVMAWSFSTYLIHKGLKAVWEVSLLTAAILGIAPGVLTWFITHPRIARSSRGLADDKVHVNSQLSLSLVFAAALLSFAHGANDVANAIGPLAAIHDTLAGQGIASKAAVPTWVMAVGALGISIGLALYGPRLIRTVGSEITELDQARAVCIALAAAVTVIVASQLGLPVSSTHIAVGGVFGVGFLREYLKTNYSTLLHEIEQHHLGEDHEVVERFLHDFGNADIRTKGEMISALREKSGGRLLSRKERKRLKKLYRKDLVKRSLLMKIIAAWVITVPFSAGLAAITYYVMRGAGLA